MPQAFINVGPGQTSIEEFVDMVFYGARQNTVTGRATIDKISGDAPISLPDEYSVRPNDYRVWMWTNNTYQFSWTNDGHLIMEVL